MSATEDLFKKVLVFVGDLYRMGVRLDALRKEAKEHGIDLEDAPESEKTIKRLKNEANVLHDKLDGQLNGIT